MVELRRTDSSDESFIKLVKLLDAELAQRDGEEHSFYDQFNKITLISHVVLAFEDGKAIACGAIKEFEPGSMEVKRMFTEPKSRGKGIALLVLDELEHWATELGCSKCVLETGKRQPEAIALYKKAGYSITPNYGQYSNMENSVCMAKKLVF